MWQAKKIQERNPIYLINFSGETNGLLVVLFIGEGWRNNLADKFNMRLIKNHSIIKL